MSVRLKKLNQQVMVITGASSGIGLMTAERAAERGAKLVLAARSAEVLESLCQSLRERGAEAVAVVADVGNEEDVRRIAQTAIERFGGFDTWVNNAAVSVYGRYEDVPLSDQKRLFDTNFWGVVTGSLVAAEHLKSRGGALINVGSEVSDVAIPLQGMYSASKHAVKGFTDSLRMELEYEKHPVSVTLIKPASIDTLFVEHAKNYMDVEPRLPAPVYAPEIVADAILHAAEHPKRDIFVGSASKLASTGARLLPRLMDKVMARIGFKQQRSDIPATDRSWNSLHAPQSEYPPHPHIGLRRSTSLYTQASTHPKLSLLLVGAAGLAVAALVKSRRTPTRRWARALWS